LREPKNELEAAIRRYVDLYDFAPIPYVSFDRSGRIEEANLAATELLELPRDLMIGRPFALFVSDLDLFLRHLLYCRTSDQRVETELRLKARKDELIPVQLSSTPITSTSKNGARLYQTALIDLRERKRAEHELELISRLPAESPAPVMRVKDGRISFANPTAQKLLDAFGVSVGDFAPVEIAQIGATRDRDVVELKLLDRTYQTLVAPVLEAGYTNLYFTDVTERKKAESTLRAKQVELDLIITKTPFMLTRCSRDLRYRYASQAYAEMLGIMPEQIAGKRIVEIMGKKGLAAIRPHVESVLSGQTVVYEANIPFLNGPHFLHCVYLPDKNEKGEVVGWIGSLVDITEQKRAEEALLESRERLRAIVEQANAGIAWYDLDGRIRFVNRRFCKMLGYLESELIDKTVYEITYPDDVEKTMHAFERASTKGQSTEIEKRYICKDGSIVWMNVFDAPERDAAGQPKSVVAVVVDVTARKKAEAALLQSKQLLEKLVRQRTKALNLSNAELKNEIERRKGLEGEILTVSDREQQRLGQELHDGLCQHLTAVAFMARSVALRLRNHRVIDAADIEKIAELVNAAVADTRNLSRALHRLDIDSAGLVMALQDLVDREIWNTPCRLEVQPSFHINDDAAAAHLYRIAREAVINANKHAQAREIVVKLERSREGMVLRVTDDGIGVPKEPELKRGLGVHIMNYRAQLTGGRLEIDSPKRGGTRVSCYLPNHAPQPLKSQKKESAEARRLPSKLTKALATLI
jgi:PAS domain S-box-containing protein